MEPIRKTVSSVIGRVRRDVGHPVAVEELEASVADHAHRQADGGPAVEDLADPGLHFERTDLGHGATGHAHVGLPWRKAVRSLRPITAMVPTATAPSTHRLGFVVAGRFWADSGITSKWTASPSRLNTTGKVPSPNSEKSIWNA